jgi:hypothetical protein
VKKLVIEPEDKISAHDHDSYVRVTFYEDGSAYVKLYGVMVANRDITGGVYFEGEEATAPSFIDSFMSKEITSTYMVNAAVEHARRLRKKALAEVRAIIATQGGD